MRNYLPPALLVLLAASLVLMQTNCFAANSKRTVADGKAAADEPKLGYGSPAAPLKVAKWLQGEPVTALAPGKVYVLEFWATWCVPCLRAMPHLSELAEKYKDKGLNVVAITTESPNNTAEEVAEFVKTTGSKYRFAFAFCDTADTSEAYMDAAGRSSLPSSFVVGRDGKIAFIGHPFDLEYVLPKVLDGTWTKADADEIAKADADYNAAAELTDKDPNAALDALDEYAKAYPYRTERQDYSIQRLITLLAAKKSNQAKEWSEPLLKKYVEKKDATGLGALRTVWTSRDLNPGRKHVEIGLAAADAALTLEGESDPMALHATAQAYFLAGKPEKAVELGEKAVSRSTDERQKTFLQKQVRKYKEGDVDEKN